MARARKPRPALTANAADAEQVENAKREESNRETMERDDLLSILASSVGRRFVWRVLTHCAPFETPFALDDRTTNKNIGRGDVGRWLLREITDTHPAALIQMMQEFSLNA